MTKRLATAYLIYALTYPANPALAKDSPANEARAAKSVKTHAEILQLSKTLRTKAASKARAGLLQNYGELNKTLKATLEDLKRQNPKEGTEAEHPLSLLSFTFETLGPLTAVKKPADKTCARVKHQIKFEDLSGAPSHRNLTDDANEALAWAQLLCEK